MRVMAIEKGYYGDKIRKPDEIFDLHDPKLFSKRWMKKIVKKKAADVEVVEEDLPEAS